MKSSRSLTLDRQLRGTPLMGGGTSDLFYDNRHTNRGILLHLDERVRHVDVGSENRAATSACGVDRVRRSGIDLLHMMAGAGDGYPGGIGIYSHDLLAIGEVACHARVYFDFACHASVESEM